MRGVQLVRKPMIFTSFGTTITLLMVAKSAKWYAGTQKCPTKCPTNLFNSLIIPQNFLFILPVLAPLALACNGGMAQWVGALNLKMTFQDIH